MYILELEFSPVSNMPTIYAIYVGPITDVAWTDLLQECFAVCPLLCRHLQQWCIQLLGQGRQSAHLNHWCWLCWQCIQLFQLAEKADMSQSTQETLLPDGEWVGSNWHGQLCCCSPSPPSHCSPGQWELIKETIYTSSVTKWNALQLVKVCQAHSLGTVTQWHTCIVQKA